MRILISLLFVISSTLIAGTLEQGTEYSSTLYAGQARVSCPNFPTYQNCYSQELEPSMRSSFITSTDADKFSLTATHESGKTRTKKGKLTNGKSKSLNLWLRSLTQRPLLETGKNVLSYKLFKNGDVVEQGEFVVNVVRNASVRCRDAYINVWDRNNCSNSSYICSLYFSQYARCE